MKGKVNCTCGWSWNKSDSSAKDMYICHECGRDNSNNMKNGGWLDNYGKQANYNDSKATASPDMRGDGYSNVGRNFSPAWGGQFQTGGKLKFLQPTSDKLPEGYRIPYDNPSTERASSIGGTNGEPAYLVPEFKYGEPLYDPIEEFKRTGEHLGGPFKTWQEAEEWENTVRHPAVENRETIMFPQEKFQTGGSIPGSVGFTYARTKGIPSNGPYAKKTLPSAQNGVDMYGNPITAELKYDQSVNRTNYNPRTNQMIFGNDMPYFLSQEKRDKTLAHENRHAWQFANDRTNFNIVHYPEYAFQDRLKKKPEQPSTDEVFHSYHDRKQKEVAIDVNKFKARNPELSFMPDELIYKRFVDNQQYDNPLSVEGEAQYYENTGERSFQNGGEMKFYQNGLDFKPKSISRDGGWLNKYEKGGIIKDDRGQWEHPGEVTEISGNTMATHGYGDIPLYVIPDKGKPRIVQPNTGTQKFPGATKFTEYPIAQNGYTTGDKVKYGTPEYEEAYKRGEVITEDGQYSPIELEEVVIPARPLTEFGKTRKEIANKNTWEQFANDRYLGNFEKKMGQTLENLPEYRKQEYEDYINKLAFDEYVKTHPQAKGEKRGAYIDRIQKANANSSNFEKAYEANAEYNPSTDVNIWRKGLMGLGSFVIGPNTINKLKQDSDYFSSKEKLDILQNPISSQIDTALGTLAPLEIPGNMLYGKNNSALEALSGRGSDVPIEARILGDPLMLIGEAAPLIGKGLSYLGGKGSQALVKGSQAISPTVNKTKTLFNDMGAVIKGEANTIGPKLNALSDAESAIYQAPEYIKFSDESQKLRQQKWSLEAKINQLKTKGKIGELNNLNDKINKLNKRIDVAEQFKVNDEGLVQSGKNTALGLRTGSTDIMDLSTGEKFPISTSVPSENFIHKLEGDKVIKTMDNSTLPQASPKYITTVKKNIDFIETQIPGAKVFGSAKNVAEADVPHIIGDYDVIMSQTQYDKFAKANPSVGNNGFAELHNIPGAAKGVDPIDINVIQEKGGKAVGERAEELFKQIAPDEYYAAAKKAIKNNSEIKIPYSSQELVDMTNPTTKSVIDAYSSSKGKHTNKIDALINYGKPSVVAEGQQQFVNSLVGSKGSIGHQFPLEQLSNPETNAEILDKIGFIGNKKLVAADPQKMQVAINDYYMNNSILARQVDKGKINKIEAAIKEYYPDAKGGAVNGIGQNHVMLGHPFHGDNNIISFKQLGMELDTADPLSYINSIEHQTSGEKLFSQEERTILSDIVKNMKFNDTEKQLAEASENASQLIENLPYSEEGKKALYEFGKQTNRTIVKKSTGYGNSTYASTLRDFDDSIDAMQYQVASFEYTKNPTKSFRQRTEAAESAARNQANISTDLELLPKQFKAIKGYVEGGIDKANQRLTALNAERTKINNDITDLSDKTFNKKYKDEIERLEAFRKKVDNEVADMNQMRRDLYDRRVRLMKLEDNMKTVGILGGGSAGLIGVGTYGYKRERQFQKEFNEKLKNMTEEERKQFDKNLEERIRKRDSLERTDKSSSDKFMDWFMGRKQNGGKITKAKDGNQLVKLDQLTNFTNYNKPQPGGWLSKYN